MAVISTPMPIPPTVDELAELLGDLATLTAEQLREKRDTGRQRAHESICGDHRHDDMHMSGFLLGLSTALALATGEQSDLVYNRILGDQIR